MLDIETNGTIDAEEAVRTAADILSDQLSVFGDFTHRDRGAPKPAATAWIRCCCARSTTSS